MRNVLRYLKHIGLTCLVIAVAAFVVLLLTGNKIKYNPRHRLADNLDREGPYIIRHGDSTVVTYIRGDDTDGFYLDQQNFTNTVLRLPVYYPVDSTSFNIVVDPAEIILPPPTSYTTDAPVFVISDIEGNYRTFRDFLITNHIIDTDLQWIFGKGHLVLLGDFVDRGYFVTQVLFLIFRLEQQANQQGGKVHFILGNHEIMNLQGNYSYSADKYFRAAAIQRLRQDQIFDAKQSLLARWLHSRNTMERINEVMFAHGGLHPQFATCNSSLDSVNRYIRKFYATTYFPQAGPHRRWDELLRSSDAAPYWYRGYFNGTIAVATIDSTLHAFGANKIVVGHTIQPEVTILHDGRVIAVDVEHPQERWGSSFPEMHSQALLIDNGVYYRVLDTGEKEILANDKTQ